jgi:hypothetical protein
VDLYDLAGGPAPEGGLTARSQRTPVDLTRSRRVGLSRTVCADCGATKDQGKTSHTLACSLPGEWVRERTGPLYNGEFSTWGDAKVFPFPVTYRKWDAAAA